MYIKVIVFCMLQMMHLRKSEFSRLFFLFVCFTAKNLVASLMEVDQDQRLTAQEAIAHEW